MATGDSLLIFTPQSNEPPATNYATLDTRNGHTVLDFEGNGTNESAIFKGIMPQHYGGGGVDVLIHYAMTTETSGDIDWDAAWERVSDSIQDIDSDGFATAVSLDGTTVPATSGLVDVITIVCSSGANMDSVAAGDGFRLKITRDGASDTATGDAELWAIELRES